MPCAPPTPQANAQKDNQVLLMAKYLDDIDIQERLLSNLVRRARAGSETLASLVGGPAAAAWRLHWRPCRPCQAALQACCRAQPVSSAGLAPPPWLRRCPAAAWRPAPPGCCPAAASQ
jgi:hypothetical protein